MNRLASITVIIPAFNVETCLKRAVMSALEQDPPPLEVIVINDGSTDTTADVARSFGDRIQYLEQPNAGPAAARNAGLAAATGKYVAFLDADDYWLPGFIKETVAFMEAHPEAVAVSTGWRIQPLKGPEITFPSTDNRLGILRQGSLLENFFDFWGQHDHVRTGTVLMRRSRLGMNGFQRTDLRICEDLEFWAYLGTLGTWGFIPQDLWFGDSARMAAMAGWLNRYKMRRKLCPNVEAWVERIIDKVNDDIWPGFQVVRGRVAANFVHNKIISGQLMDGREIVAAHINEFPKSRISGLLKTGHHLGPVGWVFVCLIIILHEYWKSYNLSH